MSYNIHHANPPSKAGVIDLDAIAAVINKYKPDVVALQEVDVNTKRSGLNEAFLLAQKTKMNFYFARAIDYDGGQYGVAILSKYALSGGFTLPLPTLAGSNGEPRVLASAHIEVNGKNWYLPVPTWMLSAVIPTDYYRLPPLRTIFNMKREPLSWRAISTLQQEGPLLVPSTGILPAPVCRIADLPYP
nr:endonuclease/exonuclease/phosphatase family protein [Paraflavitalea speifideiaquila]